MRLPFLHARCTTATKDGLGTLHVHYSWLRPNRVTRVLYVAPGRSEVVHVVPPHVWFDVVHATSFEQAMALIRTPLPDQSGPQALDNTKPERSRD